MFYAWLVPAQPTHLNRRGWYVALLGTFALHGLYFATWVSRTPEIQANLLLSTAEYGLFSMVAGLGSLIAIIFSGRIIGSFGSRRVLLVSYLALSALVIFAGLSITTGSLIATIVISFGIGICTSFGGFANNIEGTSLDRASHRSLLPSLHGAFSAGMLLGSAIGAATLAAHLPLMINFIAIACVVLAGAIWATRYIPRDGGLHITPDMNTAEIRTLVTSAERRQVWREPRTLVVAIIGLSFVLGEATAATWLPIILVDSGLTQAEAAFAFTCFAIAMTIGRLAGGFAVERLSKPVLVTIIALTAAAGIILVMLTSVFQLPYAGAVLWGLGCSLGFPLAASALSESPRLATARLRVLLVFSNIAGLSTGPLLGFIGQISNLFVALSVPVLFFLGSAASSRSTKPLSPAVEATNR